MGEVIFQTYGCVWLAFLLFWLLKPRWEIRTHPGRYAAVGFLWFVLNLIQWPLAVIAAGSDDFTLHLFRSVSRFASQYLFFAAVHLVCFGSFTKIFFAVFLSGGTFEVAFAAAQVLLTPLREPGTPILVFDTESIYTLWLILLMSVMGGLFLLVMPKLSRLYREAEIGGNLPENAVALLLWMILGSGYLPNRANMEFYGTKLFLYNFFLIAGNLVFCGIVLWSDYRVQQRKNQYMKLEKRLLKEHGKILEEQMRFSRRLQEEIRGQLQSLEEKGMGNSRAEVKEYYEKILSLAKGKSQEEYFRNPALNELIDGQIQRWREEGHAVCVTKSAMKIEEKDTVEYLELFGELFEAVARFGLKQGGAIRLSMETVLGHDLIQAEFEALPGRRAGKGSLKRLRELAARHDGTVKIRTKAGRAVLRITMENGKG